MRYRIHHETDYAYADQVDLASHMLHLSPRRLSFQSVLAATLHVDPAPARTARAPDYFGNEVTWIFLDRPHARFRVALQAEVEVLFPNPPAVATTPDWRAVAAAARAGGAGAWEAAEFAFASPLAPLDPGAGAYAAISFPAGQTILAGLLDLNRRISTEFAFRPGVTTLSTPVSRVLAQRAGVCQDFTHLMIAGLRALGLPARYVSGYLRTRPAPGQTKRRGADQSHAWVGCWLGAEHGWIDLDPTNNLVARDEHVVLAWGRDYADISPVRGIILGGGAHRMAVAVDLEAETGGIETGPA